MDWRTKHFLGDFLLKKPLEQNEMELLIQGIWKIIGNGEECTYERKNTVSTYYLNNETYELTIHYAQGGVGLQLDLALKNSREELELKMQEIADLLIHESFKIKEVKRHSFKISNIRKELKFIYFISVFTAVCSMLYELLLAQSLASVMGNTVLRYNVTIGLYIASMGVGALFYNKIFNKDYFRNFIKTEIVLSLVGLASPVLVLVCDFSFRTISTNMQIDFFSHGIQLPMSFINHLFIVIIGFFSGLELPLLTDIGRSFDERNSNKILAFDYMGTLLGAVLFPIIILPSMSLFTIGYVVSFLNILVAILVIYRFKLKFPFLEKLLYGMVVLWAIIIIFSTDINNYIIDVFYFGVLK